MSVVGESSGTLTAADEEQPVLTEDEARAEDDGDSQAEKASADDEPAQTEQDAQAAESKTGVAEADAEAAAEPEPETTNAEPEAVEPEPETTNAEPDAVEPEPAAVAEPVAASETDEREPPVEPEPADAVQPESVAAASDAVEDSEAGGEDDDAPGALVPAGTLAAAVASEVAFPDSEEPQLAGAVASDTGGADASAPASAVQITPEVLARPPKIVRCSECLTKVRTRIDPGEDFECPGCEAKVVLRKDQVVADPAPPLPGEAARLQKAAPTPAKATPAAAKPKPAAAKAQTVAATREPAAKATPAAVEPARPAPAKAKAPRRAAGISRERRAAPPPASSRSVKRGGRSSSAVRGVSSRTPRRPSTRPGRPGGFKATSPEAYAAQRARRQNIIVALMLLVAIGLCAAAVVIVTRRPDATDDAPKVADATATPAPEATPTDAPTATPEAAPASPGRAAPAAGGIAALADETQQAVDEALADGDIAAARNAVAGLRVEAMSASDPRWAERADELDLDIDRHAERHVKAEEERFERLLESGDLLDAKRLLNELVRVSLPGIGDRVRALREQLARVEAANARVDEDDDEGEGDTPTAAPAAQPVEPALTKEQETSLAARRERVSKAKAELARERAERSALIETRARRVITKTSTQPIPFEVAGVRLGDCQVTAFDEDGLAVKGDKAELRVRWNQLPLEQVYTIRRMALAADDGAGWFDLGRYMALHRELRQAEACFEKAVAADPALKERVPDLEKLRERPKLFAGEWSRVGADVLRVRWGFDAEGEAADFEADTGAQSKVENGRLLVTGQYGYFTTLKEIQFRQQVAVRVIDPQSDGLAAFGLRFFMQNDRYFTLLVVRDPKDKKLYLYREEPDAFVPHVEQGFDYDKSEPISLLMSDGRMSLYSGKKVLWTGSEGRFSDCWVVLGGFSEEAGVEAYTTFEAVEVEGRVPPKWFDRSELEEEARIFRALEYDLQLSDVAVSEDIVPEIDLAALPPLPNGVDRMLQAGLVALEKAQSEGGDVMQFLAAISLLGRAEMVAPDHPAVLFYLGVASERLGESGEALDMYTRAAERAPRLAAAHRRRASILPHLFRFEDAEAAIERALELEPDSAEGLMLRGLIRFWKTREAEALDDLELARVLEPKDLEVRQAIKDVRHVLAGPSFPPRDRRSKKTKHYEIVTDLDRAALNLYAEHLEAINDHYFEFFKPESMPDHRSQVIVFRTREAYQTYAELTTNDRAEHTLGYFHPYYRQLLLFEDLEREATLRVMYHEAFHQFCHQIAPLMPTWLDEGMAEYFGASEVKNGKVVKTGLVQKGRLGSLRAGLELGYEVVPFDRIMQMSKAEFYGDAASFYYAQAWSMVHFFFNREAWKKVLMDYLGLLREGKRNEEAFQATFGKTDLAAAQREWRRYLDGLR